MDDQRVAQRTVFGLENLRAGDGVERVCSQPVNRLGRQGDQSAVRKKSGGGGNFTGQSFGAVSLTGCRGRYAEVTVGNGYVDVTIRNLYAGTGLIMR